MGKAALDAKRGTYFQMDPNDLTLVWDEVDARFQKHGFDKIVGEKDCLDPKHPLYDARVNNPITDIEVSVAMKKGIKLPILARKVRRDDEDYVEVIDGRFRTRLARYANIQLEKEGLPPLTVKVLLEKGAGDDSAFESLVILNEHRTADDLLNQAVKMRQFAEAYDYSEEDIAPLFNTTAATVRNRFKLLELSKPVQKAARDGLITVTEALKLHGEDPEKQKELLKAHIDGAGRRAEKRKKSVGESDKAKKGARIKAPSKAKIRALIEALPQSKTRAALEWAVGDLSHKKAKEVIKELG